MTAFWSFVLTFLTSTASRYFFIFILIVMAGYAFYLSNNRRIELEKQKAIFEYNINQLKQTIKDKDDQLNKLTDITNSKSEIVNNLIKQKDDLENKMKDLEIDIERQAASGKDRPSSDILKNLFRKLGNQP